MILNNIDSLFLRTGRAKKSPRSFEAYSFGQERHQVNFKKRRFQYRSNSSVVIDAEGLGLISGRFNIPQAKERNNQMSYAKKHWIDRKKKKNEMTHTQV